MRKSRCFRILGLVILILMTHIGIVAAQSADAPRLLILPFNIHSERDLGFLQKGVETMLATRLTHERGFALVDPDTAQKARMQISGAVTDTIARRLARSAGADYVLFGDLTVFGDSVSTDAHLIDMATAKTAVRFSDAGSSHGDIIAHIDRFAGQVNADLFGIQPAPPTAQAAASQPSTRRHPERLLVEEGQQVPRAAAGAGAVSSAPQLWRSPALGKEILGMAVGDVDGDGANETVILQKDQVAIYRYQNGSFAKLTEVRTKVEGARLGLDVADINANGQAEIFVTNYHQESRRLRSFVLEYSGASYSTIARNLPWFLRVDQTGKDGKRLLGQKMGRDRVFGAPVYELVSSGGSFKAGQKLALPGALNVMGMTFGDLLNDGRKLTAFYDSSDHIRLTTPDGISEWESSESLGGGINHLETPDPDDHGEVEEAIWHYLPQRLIVADMDNDGKEELLVCRNDDTAGRFFEKLRMYSGGNVRILSWNNVNMDTVWQSSKVQGAIGDYALADFDNDGQLEIVVATNTTTRRLLGKSRSFLVTISYP